MYGCLADAIRTRANMSTNQSIIRVEKTYTNRRISICLLYSIDAPTCSHKIQFPLQFFTGIHRPINLTCFMNDANPSKLNFTWILPNGNIRLGHYLNKTSSYITVLPTYTEDFGQVTCRAQNELDLFGECHINMIMGGKNINKKILFNIIKEILLY
jgi:hypothetical protein